MSIAGKPKSIKKLRSGDLLIQCAKESHEKSLLQMKTFCGLKCSVTPHSSLNTSKGIIRCPALRRVTSDDIKEGMVEQGVTDVRRITVRRDGVTKLTNTYVIIGCSPDQRQKVIDAYPKSSKADFLHKEYLNIRYYKTTV